MKVKILVPVYNDWQSVYKLLNEIDNLQLEKNFEISILIVNDASNHDRPEEEKVFENIHSIKILNMKKIKVMQDVLLQDLNIYLKKRILIM